MGHAKHSFIRECDGDGRRLHRARRRSVRCEPARGEQLRHETDQEERRHLVEGEGPLVAAAGLQGRPDPSGCHGCRRAEGDTGAKGETGAPGSGILKPKVTGAGSSGAQNVIVDVSPSDFTFNQQPTRPNSCSSASTGHPPAGTCGGLGEQVTIKLDNTQLALQQAGKGGPGQTLSATAGIVSAATPTPHAVSVGIADDCPGAENAAATATVERFEVG